MRLSESCAAYTFTSPLAFVKNVLGRHNTKGLYKILVLHSRVVSGLVSDGFTTSMRTWSFLRADIAKANLVSDGTRVIIGSGERRQPEIKNKN